MEYPSIPMPQLMQMNLGGAPGKPAGGMGDMGARILQAALNQNKQNPAGQPQPQVGQIMPGEAGGPGGPMNITPPQPGGLLGMMQGNGGMGLLSKLFGGGLGGAGAMGGAAGGITGGLPPIV